MRDGWINIEQSYFEDSLELAKKQEREQIRARIMERVTDLKSCHKDDDCFDLGDHIEDYIPEWLG